jgi:ArsR family transcriptional regulator, arsenate/arsenite/antimonite-responsive transcriptional repressor
MAENTGIEHKQATSSPDSVDASVEPLISLASALLDTDRLRLAAALVEGPANRMQLSEVTGLSHRELLRQLDILQYHGLVKLKEPTPRKPDHYSLYELNMETFTAARKAMGRYKGVKPRPTDARQLTLETFMPGGKLSAFPRKHEQMLVILDEVAQRFEPDRQYIERDVNVILGSVLSPEVNEDYCTLRRCLVDYGYLRRKNGVYTKNE